MPRWLGHLKLDRAALVVLTATLAWLWTVLPRAAGPLSPDPGLVATAGEQRVGPSAPQREASRPAQRRPPGASASWRAEVEAFRAERDKALRADDGWLSVAGLFFLKPGPNSFGGGPDHDVPLPADAVPPRAGVLTLREGRVFFEVRPEVGARLDGAPVTQGELRPADPELERPADRLTLGRLTLLVHRSGTRLAIRLRDPESPVRTTFTGTRWFAIDPRWRISAQFVPHPAPRTIRTINVLGDPVELHSPGIVRFTFEGRTYSLVAGEEDGRLWFVFTDATAGQQTYEAARYLYADRGQDGRVVLDFNLAHNPPCAYNPFTTCPLPPRENRLDLAVTAGELDYPDRWRPH